MKVNRVALKAQYARLQTQLARPGWISQGYVQDRGPGAGGPHYQWTRKERGKTVSVALSREQYRSPGGGHPELASDRAHSGSDAAVEPSVYLRNPPRYPSPQTTVQESFRP